MKRIVINVTDRSFYMEFLKVLKSRDPIMKLRPKEMMVLAEMMYRNAQLSHLDAEVRYDVLTSTRTRKEIREVIGISEDSFNNNIAALRKYGLLTKDNRLNKSIESVVFKDNFSLEFVFKN